MTESPFSKLGLHPDLVRGTTAMGFTAPTPIQEQAIPPALTGGDPRRVLDQYSALQMRIWPDVRPGTRQNPVAPLVWLGP